MIVMTLDVETTHKEKKNGGHTPLPYFGNKLVSVGYKYMDSITSYLCFNHRTQAPEYEGDKLLQDALNNESAFKFPMGDGAGVDARGIFAHCSWGNGVVYFDTAGSTSTASSGGRVNTSGDGNFATNDITHYAFTKSINGATQTIYKDGVNVAQGTNRGPGVILSSHPVTFGGDEQYLDGWDAKMYYILVYNRELTATEVKQIYESMRGRLD